MASITGTNSTTSTKSMLTAKTGIGGLVSGMDIDALVESLTSTSRQKVIKQQQNIQRLEWKQTSYRSVTSKLREFQSKYLDVLSETNLRSESFFKTVSATSSSDKVKVSATSSATAGSITINSVTQLATNQTIKSATAVSKPLTGKMASAVAGTMDSTDIDNLLTSISGKSISLNLDGKVKTVTFDTTFVNAVNADKTTTGLQNALQASIDAAYGVTNAPDRVLTVGITNDQLSLSAAGSKVTISSAGTDTTTLAALGFTSGQSNKMTTSAAIMDQGYNTALDAVDTFKFKINSVDFSFSKTDSLSTIINKINGSEAGVKISYSSITDKFTMTADESGVGNNITITETVGNLMTAFGLTSAAGADVTAGVNAILTVNNQAITRSSNAMEIDGVQVTISETTAAPTTVTMVTDATSLFDTIKSFVNDYNGMVDMVNGLTKEEVNNDYAPLTEEQKDEMTEAQIKAWEDKAKSGILRGDSILKTISSKLHYIMTGMSVSGTSLYSIGITSAGYGENGKLKIDETKLKEALKTQGTEIKELFSSDEGLSKKLNDVINGAVKTSGVKGTRGTLVEAAGVASTMSDKENSIYDQIKRTNKAIKTLQTRLSDEEKRLWNRFTAMETAINSLNSQSSILSQFSGGS